MVMSYGARTGRPVVLPVFTQTTLVPTYTSITNGAMPSPSVNVVKIKRKFDEVKIKVMWGKGTATVSTTNNVQFNMPSGYTINGADQPIAFTDAPVVGYGFLFQAATSAAILFDVVATSATTCVFRRHDNVAVRENLIASSDYLDFVIECEVTQFAGGMEAYGAGISAVVPSLVPNYEKGILSLTATGAVTGTFSVPYKKVENQVTLKFPTIVSGGAAAAQLVLSTLPANLRPAAQQIFPVPITNSGSLQPTFGGMQIQTGGVIAVGVNGTAIGTFANAGNQGLNPISVTYLTDT